MTVFPEAEKAKLASLYAHDLPSRVWLDGYFQNRVPGVAYVDRLDSPSLVFVVTEFHHITFVGWQGPVRDFATELAEVLEQEVYLGLVAPAVLGDGFPAKGRTERRARFEFRSRQPLSPQRAIPADLANLSLAALDGDNFAQALTRGECLYAYETQQRFFRESFGLVALNGRETVGNAEAICQSVDSLGQQRADLQIAVAEPWRRRGVGRRLAEALLKELERRRIAPIWSCHADNEASLAMAKSLGFGDPTAFEIHSYEIQPGLQKYWRRVLARLGAAPETVTEVVQKLQAEFELSRLDAHWLVVTYLREEEVKPEEGQTCYSKTEQP